MAKRKRSVDWLDAPKCSTYRIIAAGKTRSCPRPPVCRATTSYVFTGRPRKLREHACDVHAAQLLEERSGDETVVTYLTVSLDIRAQRHGNRRYRVEELPSAAIQFALI